MLGAPRGARYVIREQLATGGMGVVYRAIHQSSGQERALKRLKPQATSQPLIVEAFEREYQVLASLDHPRIIRVFDYGVDEIGPYYTMELLEGEDMRAAAPLPYREACRYLRDVATSLALLHARRLIHRDLSPTNVRMTADGHVKLLDFGALSAFGNTQLVVGTAPGVPPEALDGSPLDQRADLYSLGALAYWMLTRRHAYPARHLDELVEMWGQAPASPSVLVEGIPRELDSLVMSLLSLDARARPASAGEVIARLSAIAALPPEAEGEADRLAQSFLLSPRFTGRLAELYELRRRVDAAAAGNGGTLRIEAVAGMGRTRLLEEVAVKAQLSGSVAIKVDASVDRAPHGTTRALVNRLFDALPEIARDAAPRFRNALSALGREIEARLGGGRSSLPSVPLGVSRAPTAVEEDELATGLEGWFAAISRGRPIVLLIDNVEYADEPSLGLFASLASIASAHPLLLVVTECMRREPASAPGLLKLRAQADRMALSGLSAVEMLELTRSLFGDAPNAERFADWLHGWTAGSPLHSLEISRQLVAKDVIRYSAGIWMLPVERPEAGLPGALEDALQVRIASLGDAARALAECLSLQREQPTLELCRLLAPTKTEREVLGLLDELARNDVLHAEQAGYRFSSTALREALLNNMEEEASEQNHRLLGAALAQLAGADNLGLQIEAGWHLIRGGEQIQGADMIARVASDAVTVRVLIADLHHVAEPIEAALNVYKRNRYSVYARMPLLAALAQAGYYQDREWGERYGDEALDVLEHITGLRMARLFRRFVGRHLGLMCGLLFAYLRFRFAPRAERTYSFVQILVQLFGAVTTLTGAAAAALDADRAARVADVLEPFSVLPERATPVGIYQFCRALQELARDNEASAYQTFDTLLARFQNPRYYPTLPGDARVLYVAGAHFARGAFGVFRRDGQSALESAEALDRLGLKLYSMIASQLRFLYHSNRGEFIKAAAHREQVELHAAHVGSAWQVELWEPSALIPVQVALSDVVAATRIADRLELLSRSVASLRFYARMAARAVMLVRGDADVMVRLRSDLDADERPPRSFTGWAATYAFLARGHNEAREFLEAREICERVKSHLTEADDDFGILFIGVEIELAIAEAGLGEFGNAIARIDAILARWSDIDQPLLQGLLHEARARIAWSAGNTLEFRRSLQQVERWFRPTEAPILIGRCERLAELDSGGTGTRRAFRAGGEITDPAFGSGPSTDPRTGSAVEVQTVQANPKRLMSPT